MRSLAICLFTLTTTAVFSAPPPVPSAESDIRLAREVSFETPGMPLRHVLAELSRQSGVTLEAERNIAGYRACLYVQNRPLAEVMQRLADAFDFRWEARKSKDKPPAYRFFQPQSQQQQELRELQRLRTFGIEIVRQHLRRYVARYNPADIGRLLDLPRTLSQELQQMSQTATVEELQNLPARERVIEWMVRYGGFMDITSSGSSLIVSLALSRLSPAQWSRLMAGEALQFDSAQPDSPLPVNVVDVWVKAREVEQESILRWNPQMSEGTRNFLRQEMEGYRRMSRMILSLSYDEEEGVILFRLRLVGDNPNEPPWVHHDGIYNKSGYEIERMLTEMYAEVSSRTQVPAELKEPFPEMPKPPTQPESLFNSLGFALVHIAKETRRPMVAELYLGQESVPLQSDLFASRSWQAFLETLAVRHLQIDVRDEWLIGRCTLRALSRGMDVPDELLYRCFRKPANSEGLTVEDVVALAQLHPVQLRNIFLALQNADMRRVRVDRAIITRHGQLLMDLAVSRVERLAWRFYASLSTPQRALLLRGQVLPLPMLTTNQRRLFLQIVNTPSPKPYTDAITIHAPNSLDQEKVALPTPGVALEVKTSEIETEISPSPYEVAEGVPEDFSDRMRWLETQPEEVRQRYLRLGIHHTWEFQFYLDEEMYQRVKAGWINFPRRQPAGSTKKGSKDIQSM